ncbi:hypothetical protein, partial [Planktothrix sp.]
MYLKFLALSASLGVLFLSPVSPDLSRNQKLILGGLGGVLSCVSMVWIGHSPNLKIKALKDDLDRTQKILEDSQIAVKNLSFELDTTKNDKHNLDNFYQNLINNSQSDFERQLKEFEVKLSDKTKELKNKLETQKSDYEQILSSELKTLTNKKEKEK